MSKVLKVEEGLKEYILFDKDAEVAILPASLERLDIRYAPSLEKIISLSSLLTIGPKEKKLSFPALNYCENLNEIITFGDISFNTMFLLNGKPSSYASLKPNGAPTLTSVDFDYINEFPCYNFNIQSNITKIEEAYPTIRKCSKERAQEFIDQAIEHPSVVTEQKLKVIKR